MLGIEVNFSALVVAGGSADASNVISINWQAVNVQNTTPDAFVGFAFTSDAQNKFVAHNLAGIKATYAVACLQRHQVDDVHQRVYLIELQSAQQSPA